MTEDKPQHDSEEIPNFELFWGLVILINRILIKKTLYPKASQIQSELHTLKQTTPNLTKLS